MRCMAVILVVPQIWTLFQSKVEKLGDYAINKIQTAKKTHKVLKWINEYSCEFEAQKEMIQNCFIVSSIAPVLHRTDDHIIQNEIIWKNYSMMRMLTMKNLMALLFKDWLIDWLTDWLIDI